MILDMRRSRANLPNRCCRQIDRIAYRAFDGKQWMDREGRAATTGNTYCGNLLWQSSLTLLAPDIRFVEAIRPRNNVVIKPCDNCLQMFKYNFNAKSIPVNTPEIYFVPVSRLVDDE